MLGWIGLLQAVAAANATPSPNVVDVYPGDTTGLQRCYDAASLGSSPLECRIHPGVHSFNTHNHHSQRTMRTTDGFRITGTTPNAADTVITGLETVPATLWTHHPNQVGRPIYAAKLSPKFIPEEDGAVQQLFSLGDSSSSSSGSGKSTPSALWQWMPEARWSVEHPIHCSIEWRVCISTIQMRCAKRCAVSGTRARARKHARTHARTHTAQHSTFARIRIRACMCMLTLAQRRAYMYAGRPNVHLPSNAAATIQGGPLDIHTWVRLTIHPCSYTYSTCVPTSREHPYAPASAHANSIPAILQ